MLQKIESDMRTSVLLLLSFCFLLLLDSSCANAGQLTVLDGSGKPLQHAVVELTDEPVESAAKAVAERARAAPARRIDFMVSSL